MKLELTPHERYLVVPAKQGWSVNLGADVLHFHTTREDARASAAERVRQARADGRQADWVDAAEDHPEGMA